MDLLFSIGFYIFVIAVLVAFASWFLGAFELVSIYAMTGQLFGIGPVVLTSVESVPLSNQRSPGQRIKLRNTHLKFVKPRSCVFGPRLRFLVLKRPFHIYTPIKGTITWTGSQAQFVVRMPVGIPGFLLAWATGWTVGGLMAFVGGSKPPVDSIVMLFVGLFLAGVMLALFIWLSRETAKSAIVEVRSFLQLGDGVRD